MDKKSFMSSEISLDSLEIECKRKEIKKKELDENVDTILVPFYEKDVLIKVPKRKKKQHAGMQNNYTKNEPSMKEQQRSYLMNRDLKKRQKTSYLEMFRQQFTSNFSEKMRKDPNEISSISPEFGDTERESIGDECTNNNNIVNEFYNTESYNEIYYENLMKQELEQYLDQSFEHFNKENGGKFLVDIDDNNLRSISEVSRPRRHRRRTTVPHPQNIRLGGLGPDVENIKPRLERAKSLQRYSEKVRMENRLKIYKKTIESEDDKKTEYAKHQNLVQTNCKEQKNSNKNSSYLVNKVNGKKSVITKLCYPKTKLGDDERYKEKDKPVKDINDKVVENQNVEKKEVKPNRVIERKLLSAKENLQKYVKSNYEAMKGKSSARSQGINTEEKQNKEITPVQISFLVNVGGPRPSSVLKSLEEKHRMYQEKVKDLVANMESNN